MRVSTLWRIRIIIGFVLLAALLLIARLYYLQVTQADAYREKAESQYVRTVQGLFDRNSIYFTTKDGVRVAAATLKVGYTVAIQPDFLTDPGGEYDKIHSVIPLKRDEFMEHANKKGDPYEEVADHVSEEDGDKLKAMNLPGVNLYRDQWRYYPGNNLASHVVGFVAYDGNTLKGRYGLERYYDDVLSKDSQNLFVNLFAEVFDNLGTLVFNAKPADSGDIVTTIEPTVQRTLEEEVKGAQDTWGSKTTGGIVINPKTGAIYALASYPDFNLNDFKSADPNYFKDPMVENVYEMGSIVKPLTMAAGLDSGVITRNSTYVDTGHIELSGYTISNYDGRARGLVSVQEILNQSLNVGVAHVVHLMGNKLFQKYFKSYEFGTETGIDLPGEVPGLISNLDSPRELEYANASFGQGIAMSPISIARALSSLGNGGYLVTPHVVDRIAYPDGTEKVIAQVPPKQVFSEKTSEEITRMLITVVDVALANGKDKMEHFTIAAKTGTAQIANPNGKGYYDDRYLHSFFGYFPAYDPQFLVFLYTVEPQHVNYASQTLTQPFMDMTHFLLNYYDVAPDR